MIMRANVDRNKVLLILNWCILKFGKSKYCEDYPQLRVYNSKGVSSRLNGELGLNGSYVDGTITIYLGTIKSMKELCETVIHEYKHYLQNNNEYDRLEKKLIKRGHDEDYVYENHPHEKRAEKAERKWGDVCYKELRYYLYKK